MEKTISKSEMQTILDNRPKGVSMDDVISGYTRNGYKVEGINWEKPITAGEKGREFLKGAVKSTLGSAEDLGKMVAEKVGLPDFSNGGQQGLNISERNTASSPELQPYNTAGQVVGALAPVGEVLGGAKLVSGALSESIGLAKSGASKAVGTVSPLVNKLTPDAESIMQRVARVSKGKQADFEKQAGESIGSFLDKRGIYGDVDQITEQLYKRFQQSKNNADEAIAKLAGNYQPKQVKTALEQLQDKLRAVSSEGATDPQLAEVSGLINKFNKQGLTMEEINQAKRIYEKRVKLDFLKENNTTGVTKANNIDNAIRAWQFKQAEKLGLKNLPEINRETRLNKQLLDDLGREYAGSAGNNAVSLTDWIMISGGDATAVAGFLAKSGLSSKKVQSFIAKKMSKNKEKLPVTSGEFSEPTVLPIGTYKDFLKATSKTSKPTSKQLK